MTIDNMVKIPSGTFLMGSPESEVARNKKETQHQVTISKDFWMSQYEVTQAEWEAVMGSNPSKFIGDNLPVEQVSWLDAIYYCNKLSEKEGLTSAYVIDGDNITWNRNANGYRLPTEAEWEYACRAGTTTPFNTGEYITTEQANYDGICSYNGGKGIYRGKTTPVGSFPPNNWGLYDMHGNVKEWCWDWYNREYKIDIQVDPVGDDNSGWGRVLRGGSWYSAAIGLRSAGRCPSQPENKYSYCGFRLVKNV